VSKLTAKQTNFVEEYLIDLNATQAAIRAGYSEKTANEQGARLLAKVSVHAAVETALAARSQRTEITQDMVVAGLLMRPGTWATARAMGHG
jgi:phage terminase small subunit